MRMFTVFAALALAGCPAPPERPEGNTPAVQGNQPPGPGPGAANPEKPGEPMSGGDRGRHLGSGVARRVIRTRLLASPSGCWRRRAGTEGGRG